MREHKRIPKISPAVKRLIAIEALRSPDMPRDYLAQSLREKIEAMGEIPPTEETLKRRISEARKQGPTSSPEYWHLGLQRKYPIAVEAIPRVFEIQRTLKEKYKLPEFPKIDPLVAYWIGQLYSVISEPEILYIVAHAYMLYELVSFAADRDLEVIDTSEMDVLMANGDYEALWSFAKGLQNIFKDNDYDFMSVIEQYEDIMTSFRGALKNRYKDGEQ